ncbi:MAG: CorA family divalent cation transporter, partial [Chitinophagaceae bacterium]
MRVKRLAPKYLRYIIPEVLFGTKRTKQILSASPKSAPVRKDSDAIAITVYDYNADSFEEHSLKDVAHCFPFKNNHHVAWINIDGLRKPDVEKVCEYYAVHPLIIEDILSVTQRPKMDEVDDVLYCLLNMLYFNDADCTVEQEQVSIILGKEFLLTFQEDPLRDVFDPIRDKLRLAHSKLRQRGADYLCYAMLDLIVDNYFMVMEKLGEKIELLEEEVIRESNKQALTRINQLRKEMIV